MTTMSDRLHNRINQHLTQTPLWRLTTISQAAITDPVKSSHTTATLNPGRSDARPRRRRRLRPAETIRRSPDNRPERGGRRPVAAPATVYSTANVHVLGRGCLRGHDKTYCRAGKHIVGSRCVRTPPYATATQPHRVGCELHGWFKRRRLRPTD